MLLARAESSVPSWVRAAGAADLADREEIRLRRVLDSEERLKEDVAEAFGPLISLLAWVRRRLRWSSAPPRHVQNVWTLRLLAALLLITVVLSPILGLALWIGTPLFLLAFLFFARLLPYRMPAIAVGLLLVTTAIIAVTSAFVRAPRLAPVTLITSEGRLDGGLITVTDGAWYLSLSKRRFRQVSVRQVQRSVVYTNRKQPEQIWDKPLWDLW